MTSQALDEAFAAEGSPVDLPGGALLVRAGETVETLYRISAGRLAEIEPRAEGGRLLAVRRPGDLIGGAELLGDGRFRTNVRALRDSELQAIPAGRAVALLQGHPAFLAEVAHSALSRLRIEPANRRKTSILGFVSLSEGVAVRELTERLAAAMRALGAEVAVLGAEATGCEPSYLEALEIEHDFILMVAERRDEAFAAYAGRQIDRLILVADARAAAPDSAARIGTETLRTERLIDVVLVHPAGTRRPHGSECWLDAAPVSRLFHIRASDAADLGRMARIYTGNSIGLALGGGGARAYAHLGVARALSELGIPVDFLAGTSMGAVVAACLAMGWDGEEIDRRIREAFVASSPLSDIAFPILALTRGRIVDRRLKAHFAETEIGDLWRPFACVSTDLTVGGMRLHRRGLLRRALRASLSIPGVLPPAVEQEHVLVDGALACNLPTDVVRAQHEGMTIAVDVAVAETLEPDDLVLRPSGWRWFASGAWLRGPPIVAVLIRAAVVGSLTDLDAPPEDQITIVPNLEGIRLQDWKAYDRTVEAGYRDTMAAAELLSALHR